jgi:hypothetical protein
MSPSSRPRRASIGEVVDLTKRYALQEIVGPLRNVGRWVGMGLAGAVLLGIGTLTLLIGLLRLLQTEAGDVFDGNWSFVPYVIVLVVTVAIMAIVASRIKKHGLTPREPKP